MKPINYIPYDMFLNIYQKNCKIMVSALSGDYELIDGVISIRNDGGLDGKFLPIYSDDKKDLKLN